MSVPTFRLELASRILDSLDDLDVTRAAAQMADHCFANFVLARIWVIVEQRLGGEDEARRTKSALHTAFLHKRFLDLIENATFGETFDRLYVLALRLDGEIETRVDHLAVDENRASAALTFLAGALGAGEAKMFPQHFKQSAPRRNEKIVRFAVDAQGHGQQVFHNTSPIVGAAFSRAPLTARLVKLLKSSKRNSRVARQDVRGSASSQTAAPASSSTSSAQARPRKTWLASSQVTKARTPSVVMSIV